MRPEACLGRPGWKGVVVTSSNEDAGSAGAWAAVERLLEVLAGDPGLIDEAVRDMRATVPGIARLTSEDVARHTRALFAAAVRAIAASRRPSRAELDFIEAWWAVTRWLDARRNSEQRSAGQRPGDHV